MTERKCVKERKREASIPKQNIDRKREREREKHNQNRTLVYIKYFIHIL